jgi:hypothetical protein
LTLGSTKTSCLQHSLFIRSAQNRGEAPSHSVAAPPRPFPARGERWMSDLVLAMRFLHPSFPHERQECCCLLINEGRRSAEKAQLSRGATPRDQMLPPARASGAAARPAGRARLSALHRGSRQAVTPDSAPGRVSWNRRVQTGGPSPAPVQRAPRGPVVMPDERGPKAARERFARPRAGTAPAPHLRSHPECVPSLGGLIASLTNQRGVSRTNEIAFGAFISN